MRFCVLCINVNVCCHRYFKSFVGHYFCVCSAVGILAQTNLYLTVEAVKIVNGATRLDKIRTLFGHCVKTCVILKAYIFLEMSSQKNIWYYSIMLLQNTQFL